MAAPVPLRLDIEPHANPSARKIARVVEVLHDGGVAAYPTDTVYALGCAIESRRGAERIYRAKQMDEDQKLALICPDLASAAIYAHFSQAAFRLWAAGWPCLRVIRLFSRDWKAAKLAFEDS